MHAKLEETAIEHQFAAVQGSFCAQTMLWVSFSDYHNFQAYNLCHTGNYDSTLYITEAWLLTLFAFFYESRIK